MLLALLKFIVAVTVNKTEKPHTHLWQSEGYLEIPGQSHLGTLIKNQKSTF